MIKDYKYTLRQGYLRIGVPTMHPIKKTTLLDVFKSYYSGNGNIIPLYSRLTYYLFGVNFYIEDTLFYRVFITPFIVWSLSVVNTIMYIFRLC